MVIYGVGKRGRQIDNFIDNNLNIKIECFIDNNPDLTGTVINKKKVVSADVFFDKSEFKGIIIIGILNPKIENEIIDELRKRNYNELIHLIKNDVHKDKRKKHFCKDLRNSDGMAVKKIWEYVYNSL